MLHWLAETGNNPVDFSLYIKTGTGAGEIEKELVRVLDRGQVLDELAEKSAQSPTGAVIYYGRGSAYVIQPPFPLQEEGLVMGYNAERLRKMLENDLLLGLVLVRLGHYAVGVFKGEVLVEGKAGTGLVHARHHKGGSSANRFARHREKQMEYFFTRIEQHSREILEKHIKGLDHVFYGGTRDTLVKMWKQCGFYKKLEGKVVDRLLALREPRRSNFNEAIAEAYSSRIFELIE
jgi:peptide subunit release factor 1 (eRF1)